MNLRFKERYTKKINHINLLELLSDKNSIGHYNILDVAKRNNTIVGYLFYNNKRLYCNYMDRYMRKFTQILSEDLRDIMGKNIFYNIVDGVITFQI